MTVTRPPSVQLLRALRSIVHPSTTQSQCQILPSKSIIARTITNSAVKLAAAAPPPPPAPLQQPQGHTGGQSPQVSRSRMNPNAPSNRDRGPASSEDTQTDFGAMDIYSNTPEPATSIDACTTGGFHLNNGTKITGGSGVLLAGGEAFSWKPWLAFTQSQSAQTPRISDLLDKLGRLHLPNESLTLLKLLHPKPDLMIIGTGSRTLMLSPQTREYINLELGMRLDVMDTANASAAYNLLATERGVEGGAGVGGLMLPIGWKGTK